MRHLMTITAPPGWLLIEDDTWFIKRRVVRSYYRKGDFEGIAIVGDPTDDENQIAAALTTNPQEAQAQAIAERDRLLVSIPYDTALSDGESLGERTINGAPAAGAEYTKVIRDHTYKWQVWFVWRPEEIWTINLTSAPDSAEIAPELIDALDALRWDPIPGYHPSSQSDQSSGQSGQS